MKSHTMFMWCGIFIYKKYDENILQTMYNKTHG